MNPSKLPPLPRVAVNLPALRHNLESLLSLCSSGGIEVAIVTKVVCADPQIVRLIEESGAHYYADSRWENLRSISKTVPQSIKPKILLRLSGASQVEEVVRYSQASLESEAQTIAALGAEAERQNKIHKIILMIDLGDLREGIYSTERQRILETATLVARHPHLELWGVGVNLTCYGSIIPDEDNLGELVEIAHWLRRELSLPIPVVSGGNSSSLFLISEGRMPSGVNHLRLGESFTLGNDTANCCLFPGLREDTFTLEAEIVELQTKPSKPRGKSGANAFGEKVEYVDRGLQRRAILALVRQDINAENLIPLDPQIEILGASSDHLLLNLSACQIPYQLGDVIRFRLDYGNLLRTFTSPYINRYYLSEED